MKKLSKLLTLCGTNLLCCSALSPLITNGNIGYSKAIKNNYAHRLLQTNGLTHVNNRFYSRTILPNETTDASIITQERLDNYINAIQTKLQFQLMAARVDDADIQDVVSKFLANVRDYVPQGDNIEENQIMQAKYNYVQEQANKLGVDVIDFEYYYNTFLFDSVNLLKDKLVQLNASADQIDELCTKYTQDLLSLLDQAQKQMWDNTHIDLKIAELNNKYFDHNYATGELLTSEQMNKKLLDARLAAVLRHVQNANTNILTLQKSNTEFLNHVIGYGSTPTIGEVKENTEIDSNLFKYLFNYKYNKIEGFDFADHGYTPVDIKPAEVGGDYNMDIVNLQTEQLPLDRYTGEYAIYSPGDVLPGYKLHLYVTNIDEDTNSHECRLSVVFGISKDSNNDYVLWDTPNGKINDDAFDMMNQEDKDTSTTYTLSVDSQKQIENISNNVYYPKKEYQVNIPDADLPKKESDAFFTSSVDKRTKLDKIMANNYHGDSDTYDLKNHPMYLSNEDDLAGICIPDIAKLNISLHKNQSLKFVANDIDTNKNTLTGHFAIVDTFTDESTNQKKTIEVKKIIWKNKVNTYNDIKVQFDISKELKVLISVAQIIGQTVKSMDNMSNLYTNVHDDKGNNLIDRFQSQVKLYDKLAVAQEVMLGALTAMTILEFVLSCITGGFGIFAMLNLLLTGAFTATSALTIMQYKDNVAKGKAYIDAIQAVKGVFVGKENYKVINNFYNKIKSDIDILNNDKIVYWKKEQAANALIETAKEHKDFLNKLDTNEIYKVIGNYTNDEIEAMKIANRKAFINPLDPESFLEWIHHYAVIAFIGFKTFTLFARFLPSFWSFVSTGCKTIIASGADIAVTAYQAVTPIVVQEAASTVWSWVKNIGEGIKACCECIIDCTETAVKAVYHYFSGDSSEPVPEEIHAQEAVEEPTPAESTAIVEETTGKFTKYAEQLSKFTFFINIGLAAITAILDIAIQHANKEIETIVEILAKYI